MASKIWKRMLFIVLILACIFDVTLKLVKRNSLKTELQAVSQYLYEVKDEATNKAKEVTKSSK